MDEIRNEIYALNSKMETIVSRQDKITKLIAENNVLLRRNLGILDIIKTTFPIDSKKALKDLESDLKTEKKLKL